MKTQTLTRTNTKLVVAVALLGVAVVAFAALPVSIKLNTLKAAKSACPGNWTNVFHASGVGMDSTGNLDLSDVTKNISFRSLQKYQNAGCEFRVVREDAKGGASNTESYTCQLADLTGVDGGVMSCKSSPVHSSDTTPSLQEFETKISWYSPAVPKLLLEDVVGGSEVRIFVK